MRRTDGTGLKLRYACILYICVFCFVEPFCDIFCIFYQLIFFTFCNFFKAGDRLGRPAGKISREMAVFDELSIQIFRNFRLGFLELSPGTGLVRPRGCCVSAKASSIYLVYTFAKTEKMVFK
jgi:hypothetical protein